MSSHRAPRRRNTPRRRWALRPQSVRLLVPAAVVTALVAAGFVLLPRAVDLDPTAAHPSSEGIATHEAASVSRSHVRGALESTASDEPIGVDQGERATRARKAERMLKQRTKDAAARRKRERREAREAAQPKVSSFRVGALNILGSQHTRGPGGYGPGTERAGISAGIIMARGVDVVTLSEVQDDQLAVLNNRLAGYSIWPQHSLGRNGQRLQIAWRSDRFEMVDGGSVTFTFASQQIPKPYVRLRDRATGAEFWVISTHLSAGKLEAERDSGTAITISLIQQLLASSGKPVIVGGDVNEHEEFFYDVCGATGFLAANGGGPGCALPPRPLRVDWIMGGGGDGVDFSGYVQDGSTLARASDHYFIHANVSVTDPGGQS